MSKRALLYPDSDFGLILGSIISNFIISYLIILHWLIHLHPPTDFGLILGSTISKRTSISWFRFWFDFGVNHLKKHFYILIQILVWFWGQSSKRALVYPDSNFSLILGSITYFQIVTNFSVHFAKFLPNQWKNTIIYIPLMLDFQKCIWKIKSYVLNPMGHSSVTA